MPHELAESRETINALIGPIEAIIAQAQSLPGYVKTYTLGGLEQALETLSEAVNAIDEYEEEPAEPDAPAEEEPEEDDDDSEDDDYNE